MAKPAREGNLRNKQASPDQWGGYGMITRGEVLLRGFPLAVCLG
jgi:hypothetical protein